MFFIPLFSFGQWVQIGTDINGESSNDGSGVSVSLSADGSMVAIGADSNGGAGFSGSGYVRVFQNQSGDWVQIGQTLEGNGGFDQFGYTVSLSADGNFLAVSADSFSPSTSIPNRGKIQVYENQSGTWVQVGQDIEGEAAEDYFGFSLSISADGNRVAVGAPFNDSGYAKVYENQSGTWTQIGQKIEGEAMGDQSGIFLNLSSDGNTLAIGADLNDGNGTDSGHVRVYGYDAGSWVQVGQDIDGDASEDFFGVSVNLSSDGTILAVGAIGNDTNGTDSGHVKVFENQSDNWVQVGQDIDGEAAGDESGFSVNLSSDGSVVAVGAWNNDGNGTDSGHVKIYRNESGTWTQIGQNIEGEAASNFSGQAVSLSSNGGIVAIGAPGNNDNGSESGHVRIFEDSSVLSVENDLQILGYIIISKDAKISVLSEETIQLTVYNMLGMEVRNQHLSTGIYMARITNLQGNTEVQKVWVE